MNNPEDQQEDEPMNNDKDQFKNHQKDVNTASIEEVIYVDMIEKDSDNLAQNTKQIKKSFVSIAQANTIPEKEIIWMDSKKKLCKVHQTIYLESF